ncbi:MAG: AI-2E family transporter, partial [Nitrospirae bacterium]|nr:AI-2E family transporter [Nitrospirota bacterium]
MILVIYLLYQVSRSFLAPLAWAAILAIFFFPVHKYFLGKVESANLAAFFSVTAVGVLLIAPLGWIVPAFAAEAASVIRQFRTEELLPQATAWIERQFVQLPLPLGTFEEMANRVGREIGGFLAAQSARLAGNVALFLFHVIVMLLTMFYLFRDGSKLISFLKDISPLGGDYSERMRKEVSDLISVTLSSGFVVSAVQGTLGGLVFLFLGMPSPLFWGVIIAFLAFLPIVGPWLVWIPAAIGSLIHGDVANGIALAALGLVLISGADNVLRPMLIAGRSQLNGLLVFVGVLGGISA